MDSEDWKEEVVGSDEDKGGSEGGGFMVDSDSQGGGVGLESS
jgi:hypothetical protein